mgnify:CR=1 FL=1
MGCLLTYRNYIISHELSNEIIDSILNYMLEGWHFGEKKSNLKVAGFVPSLKSDGPLSIRDAIEVTEHGKLKDRNDDEFIRGDPEEKWKLVAHNAKEAEKKVKAIKLGSEQDLLLKRTENTLRFGLFSLAMMYFRSMTILRKQKNVYSDRYKNLYPVTYSFLKESITHTPLVYATFFF